jgi:hypothetical protein
MGQRQREGGGEHSEGDPGGVAAGADYPARRFGILSGRVIELVRRTWGGRGLGTQNARLLREVVAAGAQAASQFQRSGKAARVFTEFEYQTRNSWSRARRVIAKAEHLEKGANPRFVVTSLSSQENLSCPVPLASIDAPIWLQRLKGKPAPCWLPFGCVTGLVAVEQQRRRELLQIGGEVNGGSCLPAPLPCGWTQ